MLTLCYSTGSARRAARRETAAPYKGDGAEDGIIARMLQDDEGVAHTVNTNELEARAEHETQGDGEGADGDEQDPSKPDFAALTAAELAGGKVMFRRVPVPAHRFTPLKEKWMDLYQPIVKHMKLQIRMNLKTRSVELRTSEHTEEVSALQKSHDFIRAFLMGFDVQVLRFELCVGGAYVRAQHMHVPHSGCSVVVKHIGGKGNEEHISLESRYSDALALKMSSF